MITIISNMSAPSRAATPAAAEAATAVTDSLPVGNSKSLWSKRRLLIMLGKAMYYLVATLVLIPTCCVKLAIWLNKFRRERQLPPVDPTTQRKHSVAIIGGGIAGCSAAWALKRAGYHVEIFETRHTLGGNAKTVDWEITTNDRPLAAAKRGGNAKSNKGGAGAAPADRASSTSVISAQAQGQSNSGAPKLVRTGLSVLAWPPEYFRNYRALLAELGVTAQTVDLPFLIRGPHGEKEYWDHSNPTTKLQVQHADDIRKWNEIVSFVRSVNGWIHGTGEVRTLYGANPLNPLNYIPLKVVFWWWGMSANFWENVFVPVYSSSFLTAQLEYLPAIIAPAIDDIIPLRQAPRLDTWDEDSSQVFDKMTAQVEAVHLEVEVHDVFKDPSTDKIMLSFRKHNAQADDANVPPPQPSKTRQFDRVIFACPSPAVLSMLSKPSLLQKTLLNAFTWTDDDYDNSFTTGIIHSDPRVIPEDQRAHVLRTCSNFIDVKQQPPPNLADARLFVSNSTMLLFLGLVHSLSLRLAILFESISEWIKIRLDVATPASAGSTTFTGKATLKALLACDMLVKGLVGVSSYLCIRLPVTLLILWGKIRQKICGKKNNGEESRHAIPTNESSMRQISLGDLWETYVRLPVNEWLQGWQLSPELRSPTLRKQLTEKFTFENTFVLSSWIPKVQREYARMHLLQASEESKTHANLSGIQILADVNRVQVSEEMKRPMLISYNLHPSKVDLIASDLIHPVGTVTNIKAHPHLSLRNLALAQAMRLLQGVDGFYYISSWCTPGTGHDLSLLSGFAVANAIGASYPFEQGIKPAVLKPVSIDPRDERAFTGGLDVAGGVDPEEARRDFERMKTLLGV